MNSWSLQGKTAVVCGASAGIGAAAAQLLAERGARIIAVARNEEKLQQLVTNLSGQRHSYFAIDLGETLKLKQEVLPSLQNEVVHILINNSGGPKGGFFIRQIFLILKLPCEPICWRLIFWLRLFFLP